MVKKLFSSIREYKTASIISPLFVILEVILEVLIPFLMANLIDYGIDDGNMNYILKMGIALVFSALITILCGGLAGKYAAYASAGFAKNLRKDMFYKVQNFSFSNIDKFSTSGIITRLTTDVSNVQNAYMMLIRMAIRSPIMLICAVFASVQIDGKLSLIFLGCIPILGVGLGFIISKVYPIFKKVFQTYDELNNVVQENLHGIRVVKSFTREKFEEKKFGAISNKIYKYFTKAETTLSYNMPLMQFCMYACMLLISWIGARAIISSGNNPAIGLSTGELMSLFTYVMQILMSLMILSMVFVMVTMSRADMERIVEILDEESDIKNPDVSIKQVKDGSIKFENVSFSYANKAENLCLKNINFEIKSGETIGIIGGTGSAKSTLVQLIPRLYDVSDGEVLVGGINVKNYDLNSLRNSVSMVLQKNTLFYGTIKENLRWGNENASDNELIEACKLAQAHEFIESFPNGYDTIIEQEGKNVSGGQKQRICIARALLKNPKILILDDSTSAVDTKTDSLLRAAFTEKIPHTTKIIIAQRVSSIESANRVIVMDNGEIVNIGTHNQLMEVSPIYKEVYESQMRGGDGNA